MSNAQRPPMRRGPGGGGPMAHHLQGGKAAVNTPRREPPHFGIYSLAIRSRIWQKLCSEIDAGPGLPAGRSARSVSIDSFLTLPMKTARLLIPLLAAILTGPSPAAPAPPTSPSATTAATSL